MPLCRLSHTQRCGAAHLSWRPSAGGPISIILSLIIVLFMIVASPALMSRRHNSELALSRPIRSIGWLVGADEFFVSAPRTYLESRTLFLGRRRSVSVLIACRVLKGRSARRATVRPACLALDSIFLCVVLRGSTCCANLCC